VLGRGGDVELVIDRTNASGRVVGGHVAMVTGMKKIAPHVRQITYVDDPVQGDGVAASREHVIVVSDLNGNFTRCFVREFMLEDVEHLQRTSRVAGKPRARSVPVSVPGNLDGASRGAILGRVATSRTRRT